MPKLLDITGHRFGRLTVLEIAHKEKRPAGSRVFWRCLCDCGKESAVAGDKLKSGHSTSCGCIAREILAKRCIIHGHSYVGKRNPTYTSWANMLQRCQNPKHPKYLGWGGRGITVCERWQTYQSFLDDMGERPPGLTLDRIEVNGPYAPGNCRWASALEQRLNQRRNQKR
jgi:hypothetical protein